MLDLIGNWKKILNSLKTYILDIEWENYIDMLIF